MPLDERPWPPMAAILADEGLTDHHGPASLFATRAGAADDGAHAWADAGEWAEAKLIVRATLGLALGGGDEKAARALALGGADVDDAARAAWARMVRELALGDGDGAEEADGEWAAAAAKVRAALGLALGRADDDATRARWDRMLREISEEPPNVAPET